MGGTGGFGAGIHWSPLWMLLALVVLAGAVYLAGRFLRAEESTTADENALAVLRRRYATGDIDEAELEERRAQLSETRYPR